MSKNFQFESFSIITKEERVQSLSHSIIPNTFALEIITPLPGYYGAEYLISREIPGHVILMTKDYLHFEEFYRLLRKMKAYLNFSFDASLSSVEIHNHRFHGIRVRDIDSYQNLGELQRAFASEGILMAKPRKVTDLALIRIKKFLRLSSEVEGVYHDRETTDYHYVVIQNSVSWKLFEKVTHRIRNNHPELKYDVALGVLFRSGDLQDVIRIYGENLSLKTLQDIQYQYIKALSEHI